MCTTSGSCYIVCSRSHILCIFNNTPGQLCQSPVRSQAIVGGRLVQVSPLRIHNYSRHEQTAVLLLLLHLLLCVLLTGGPPHGCQP
jgi:hypothetical protein